MTTITTISDTYVAQNRPTQNYNTSTRLKMAAAGGSNTERLSLMYWSRPFELGVTIETAKLYIAAASVQTGTLTMNARRLTSKPSFGRVHYNNDPGVGPIEGTATRSNAAANTWWEIDLKTLMQAISDGTPWYGIQLSINGTTEKVFHSAQAPNPALRPYLVIEWSTKPKTPTQLSPSNNLAVSVAQPVLTFDFSDPRGTTGLAAYQVQIDDVADFITPVFDTGEVASTVPQYDTATATPGGTWAGMTNNQVRYWRVRVMDSAGRWSDWSAAAQMRRVDLGTIAFVNPARIVTRTNTVTTQAAVGGTTTTTAGVTFEGRSDWRRVQGVAGGGTWRASSAALVDNVNYTGSWLVANDQATAQTVTVDIGDTGITNFTIQPGETRRVTMTATKAVWGTAFLDVAVASGGNILVSDPHLERTDTWTGEPFNGATPDTPYTDYAWSGTAGSSTSTAAYSYIDEATPPLSWTSSFTQAGWEIEILDALRPGAVPFWDSGYTNGTEQTITVPSGKIVDFTKVYRIRLRVWDTVSRIAEGGRPAYVELERDVVVRYDGTIAHVTNLVMTQQTPYPVFDLTWSRGTMPDAWVIMEDGVRIVDEFSGIELLTSGTNYKYTLTDVSPRIPHTYKVLPKSNDKMATYATAPGVNVTLKPIGTWLMRSDGTDPIVIVKSGDQPQPAVEALAGAVQQTFQPVGGGAPVLISQYQRGYEGSVDGVLADGIATGLTGRIMRDRLKKFKENSGEVLKLFLVDEVLPVVIFNITYRSRAKAGGLVIYDIRFEFFQADA